MASSAKRPNETTEETNEFYEAMPATWNPGIYRDDEADFEDTPAEDQLADSKRTAVITLALAAITAIILGVLFVRMLGSVENNAPLPDGPTSAASTL